MKHWNALISKRPDYWDQNAFNDLLKSGYTGKPMPGGLFKGYNQKLRAGILPVATFCSGHTYFVQRLPMRCAPEVTLLEGLHPALPAPSPLPSSHRVVVWLRRLHRKAYVVHATFQFSGSIGKRHRFREMRLWSDPPEYYDPPTGGFLSYTPYIPDALKKKPNTHNPTHLIQLHFKLVNYQLSQVLPLASISDLRASCVRPPAALRCSAFSTGGGRQFLRVRSPQPRASYSVRFACRARTIRFGVATSKSLTWPRRDGSCGARWRWRPRWGAPSSCPSCGACWTGGGRRTKGASRGAQRVSHALR